MPRKYQYGSRGREVRGWSRWGKGKKRMTYPEFSSEMMDYQRRGVPYDYSEEPDGWRIRPKKSKGKRGRGKIQRDARKQNFDLF